MQFKFGALILSLFFLLNECSSMTIGEGEEVELPDELKPIERGGSWFDDMAIERLKRKHQKLIESGTMADHVHEKDSEEMFILAKLGKTSPEDNHAHHPHIIKDSSSTIGTPALLKSTSNRDSLKFFLSNHKKDQMLNDSPVLPNSEEEIKKLVTTGHKSVLKLPQSGNLIIEDSSEESRIGQKKSSMTSDEFLNHYEKELHNFFRSFMKAMLQAEMHEVRIEEKHE